MILTYSPKISEDLIPILYRIGKEEGKPMTKVVDRFLRDSIGKYLNDLQHEIPQGQEKESPQNRIEALLDAVNRDSEYTVRHKEKRSCYV